MPHDSRLYWVQANRRRTDPVRRAGSAVESLVGEACRAASARGELQQLLDAAVDEEFRRHCFVSRLSAGTLFIRVDAPVLVSVMRRRWLEPLRRVLKKAGRRGQGVRNLVFEYGND